MSSDIELKQHQDPKILYLSQQDPQSYSQFQQNPQISPQQQQEGFPCQICCSLKSCLIPIPNCNHQFCQTCLKGFLSTLISEAQVQKIKCPHHLCLEILTQQFLLKYLDWNDIGRLVKFRNRKQIENQVDLVFCPFPDCEGYGLIEKKKKKIVCRVCSQEFCKKCRKSWHKGWCRRRNHDQGIQGWTILRNIKYCPQCKFRVEKAYGGCSHMSCQRCSYYWCWICGQSLNDNHSKLRCIWGKRLLDVHWDILILLMFFPILLPFFPLIIFYEAYSILQYKAQQIRNRCLISFMRQKLLLLFIMLVVSPILVGLAFLFVLVATMACLMKWRIRRYYSRCRKLKEFLVIFFLYIGVVILEVLGLGLAMIVSPVMGLVLLVCKFFYFFVDFKKPKSQRYPRTLLGFILGNYV